MFWNRWNAMRLNWLKSCISWLLFSGIVLGQTSNLCRVFTGDCRPNCTYEFVHRWPEIHLCPDPLDRCCAPDHFVKQFETTPTETPSSSTVPSTTPPSISTSSSNTTANDSNMFDSSCGISLFPPRLKRIVGGMISRRGAWPWQVSLRLFNGRYICGGTLIGNKWVLTVAHCFKRYSNPSLWRVVVGQHNLFVASSSSRELRINTIIKHHGYLTRTGSGAGNGDNNSEPLSSRYLHDIALLELREQANTNEYVRPICLPPMTARPSCGRFTTLRRRSRLTRSWYHRRHNRRRNELEAFEMGDCWVTGWGSHQDTSTTFALRQVHGPVMDNIRCSGFWNTSFGNKILCFGDGTYGPCSGDSGSPLSCRSNGTFYLAGLVSWGTDGCDLTGYPGVFTRIASYLPWINRHINNV